MSSCVPARSAASRPGCRLGTRAARASRGRGVGARLADDGARAAARTRCVRGRAAGGQQRARRRAREHGARAAWRRGERPVSADHDRVEGDRRASGAHRVSVCAPVDAAPGACTNTESAAAPVRAAPARGRARLAARADRRDRLRPGPVGRSSADREGFQRLVAEVGLGKAGIVLGPGGLPAGAQQRRLAPAARDLRARRAR